MWLRHIADSAQIYKITPEPKRWIDLGSGGGFPGVITAILQTESGKGWVDLVESNHKKASFLRTALTETGARGSVHAIRIEDAAEKLRECDAISARALADLDQLLAFAEPWALRNPALRCYFHKGRDYQTEIDKARGRWAFDLVIHRSAIEPDSVILELAGCHARGSTSVRCGMTVEKNRIIHDCKPERWRRQDDDRDQPRDGTCRHR